MAAAAGCGGESSGLSDLARYDESLPLRVEVEAENQGSTDIAFQSPRGGDVKATLVMPAAAEGRRYPAVIYSHPYQGSRALFFREAFDMAERGIAALLIDSVLTRDDVARVDLMDPVYAGDAFRSVVRHDLVDLQRAMDYLETREDIDAGRIALVGQEFGGLAAGGAAAVDDRVVALVLSAVPAEPGRYWAKEFVPPESHESYADLLRDFDPIRLLDSMEADVLLQLPRRDEDWPLREYERLAENEGDAEVKWYPEYGHQMGPDADADRRQWLIGKLTGG